MSDITTSISTTAGAGDWYQCGQCGGMFIPGCVHHCPTALPYWSIIPPVSVPTVWWPEYQITSDSTTTSAETEPRKRRRYRRINRR